MSVLPDPCPECLSTSCDHQHAGTVVELFDRPVEVLDSWTDPRPLRRVPPLPPAILTGPLGQLATAVSHQLEQPVDYAWMNGLAAVSAATFGNVVAAVSPGHLEPLALYLMPCLPSGARKSEASAIVNRPLREWERERGIDYRGSADAISLELVEAELEKLKRKPLDEALDTDHRADLISARIAERQAVELELEQLRARRPKQLTAGDDTTPEALAMFLAHNGGAAYITSAEGGLIGNLKGRYGGGMSNLDVVLKAHSGEPIIVDRVGRDRVTVERASLTLCIGAQPHVLDEVRDDPAMRERGFLSRFLVALPPSGLGYRRGRGTPAPGHVLDAWQRALVRMLNTFADMVEPRAITFTPDASEAWLDSWREVEAMLRPGALLSSPPALLSWGSKLPGQLARVAALLELLDDPHATVVTVERWHATAELIPYLAAHAQLAQRPKLLTPGERMLAFLRDRRPWTDTPITPDTPDPRSNGGNGGTPSVFTTRQLWQLLRDQTSWITDTSDVRTALRELADHGWIRALPREHRGGRPSEAWEPHPQLLEQLPASTDPDDLEEYPA